MVIALLLLAFLTFDLVLLKWTGVIDWSWFWVLSPSWAPAVLVLGYGLGLALFDLYERRKG